MLKSRLGLSLEYTLTKLLSHSKVVKLRGKRFFMSQKTARPRFTSCFIRRIRASLGQHLGMSQGCNMSVVGCKKVKMFYVVIPYSLAVVVPDDVLVVGVRVLSEVALNEVLGLISGEPEKDVGLKGG